MAGLDLGGLGVGLTGYLDGDDPALPLDPAWLTEDGGYWLTEDGGHWLTE